MERVEHWRRELDTLASNGVEVVTVASPDYPSNVAAAHDRPPLLFVQGRLDHDADRRAVAVGGTRAAGEAGLRLAETLAQGLAGQDVVVVSGLAAGIDAAAHRGAIDGAGRMIAVFGTGIRRVYPAENRRLASQVREHGACVSQFWPDQGPTRWTFPIRNVVTSAFAVATVVVEASETSGAKLQAERALAHGKRVVLTRQLVDGGHEWADRMRDRPAVTVADSVDDILEALQFELAAPSAVPQLVH